MLKNYLVGLATGIIITLIFLGIYSSFLVPTESSGLIRLRVGHLLADQLHQPGWVVAEEMNYFKQEAFQVFHSEYQYGSIEMEHFAAGELDLAYVGAVPFLSACAAGVDIIAVASSNTEGSSLVVTKEIQEIEDLNGKIIGSPGIGSIQDYMLDRIKEVYEVEFSIDRSSVTILLQKFSTGEIDGYIAWEPNAIRAVVEGIRGAHTLLVSHDILPNHQCCVLAVRGDWVREKPYIVRRIVRWHMNAMKWVLENPEEFETLIADYSGLSIELIEAAHTIVKHPYPPRIDVASMRIMLEGQIKAGKINTENLNDLDIFLNEVINNSYVEELDEELRPPFNSVLESENVIMKGLLFLVK
jgi:NitT/TauT family transport system substrate-binding protein